MSLFSWFQDAWRKFRGPDFQTGDLVQVANKGKYRTANAFYYAAHLREGAWSADYLFTESELVKAEERAQKNSEDLPWDDDGKPKAAQSE